MTPLISKKVLQEACFHQRFQFPQSFCAFNSWFKAHCLWLSRTNEHSLLGNKQINTAYRIGDSRQDRMLRPIPEARPKRWNRTRPRRRTFWKSWNCKYRTWRTYSLMISRRTQTVGTFSIPFCATACFLCALTQSMGTQFRQSCSIWSTSNLWSRIANWLSYKAFWLTFLPKFLRNKGNFKPLKSSKPCFTTEFVKYCASSWKKKKREEGARINSNQDIPSNRHALKITLRSQGRKRWWAFAKGTAFQRQRSMTGSSTRTGRATRSFCNTSTCSHRTSHNEKRECWMLQRVQARQTLLHRQAIRSSWTSSTWSACKILGMTCSSTTSCPRTTLTRSEWAQRNRWSME